MLAGAVGVIWSVIPADPAVAGIPVVSVANATVACKEITGTATFSPPLRTNGSPQGLETVHLDLTVAGCVSGALPPPITVTGHLKGSMVSDNGQSCATTLAGARYSSVGAFIVQWRTHGAKIAPDTQYSPQRVRPVKARPKSKTPTEAVELGAASGKPTVAGDFTGGDGGKSSSLTLDWLQSAATCATGLHSLPITAGALSFS
jgi:hypothetical protein